MELSLEKENLQKVTKVLIFYTEPLDISLKVGKVEKIGEVEELFIML